jgi:hypothetical protein
LPIVIAYLGHAYWVFRGKTASAYEDLDAEVAPSPVAGHPTSLQTDLHLN